MAGHSKWSNTKHRKSIKDMKKNKIFTKIIREIITATKIGGSRNPEYNPKLRVAMNKALLNNMTRNTINKAISKCICNKQNTKENFTYEGYSSDGIAIIVDCISDNRNRTVSEVRNAFNKGGGNMSNDGSVSYLFQKKGILSFSATLDENYVINKALDLGLNIEDLITKNNGTLEIVTACESLYIVKRRLENSGLKAESAKISMIPFSKININNSIYLKLKNLISLLKNCQDVKEIYHNADIIKSISQ